MLVCALVDTGTEAQTCPNATPWLGELAHVTLSTVLMYSSFAYPPLSQLSQRNVL